MCMTVTAMCCVLGLTNCILFFLIIFSSLWKTSNTSRFIVNVLKISEYPVIVLRLEWFIVNVMYNLICVRVYLNNCMLHYASYNNIFPCGQMWPIAIQKYLHKVMRYVAISILKQVFNSLTVHLSLLYPTINTPLSLQKFITPT